MLLGTFTANKTWAATGMVGYFPMPKLFGAIAASAVILAAMYLLTMYQKLMFGPLDKPENKTVRDLHGRETWVFGIMVVAALVMGIAPQPILSRSEKSVNAFITGYRDRLQDARRSPETLHVYPAFRPRRRARRPLPRRRPPSSRPEVRCRAMNFDSSQIFAFTPLLILIGMGCVVLLAETFVRGQSRAGLAWLAVAGCVVALVAVVMQWPDAAEAKTYFD